ncbi:putative short chain dehydrogenase/ reductase [Myxozyma melibiosi]|uniref:Short chain dehydrogenase/ reductase n=1 Tax=Myxozyma melibiosi TaxID=54550 RepID=A0ABR1F1K9_9ASCO
MASYAGIKGRVYVVTGAASGIGRATVLKLAQLGAKGVAISDLNEAGLEETKKLAAEYATKIVNTKLDVSKISEIEAWIDASVKEFGQLDGAANVAGLAGGDGNTTVATLDQSVWDRTLGVNLTGLMACMRRELKYLPQPGGAIVNVASTAGLRGLPLSAAYSTSKFGVVGLTQSAAGEFGEKGVRINAVCPGPIDTAIFRDGEKKGLFDANIMSAGTYLKRMGKASEIANVIVFLLSEDSSFVCGSAWAADGGYTAH